MQTISVIIPSYNSAKYLEAAVDSVLAQTYNTLEIIIVDDGSTDDTKSIVKSYGDKLIYHYQENSGPGIARNTGIDLAAGEWIAFLDSDDVWQADHLQKLMTRVLSRSEADMVYGAQRYVDESGKRSANKYVQTKYPEGWIFADLFEVNYVATPAVIVRRSLLHKLGGFSRNEVFRNAEDYDLWLRIAANSVILSEPKVVFDYRRHTQNSTLNERKRVLGMLAALNNAIELINSGQVNPQNHPELIDIRARMIEVYRHSVGSLFYIGAYDDARVVGFTAVKNNYASVDLLLRALLSCLPGKLVSLARTIHRL